MLFLEVNAKTLFTKLDSVFPECSFLIERNPNLHRLICLKGPCFKNANCMGKLAVRVKCIFDTFQEAELLVLYFRHQDGVRHRAGVFWKDMREPRFITMNPWAWEKFKNMGTVYDWELPTELMLT